MNVVESLYHRRFKDLLLLLTDTTASCHQENENIYCLTNSFIKSIENFQITVRSSALKHSAGNMYYFSCLPSLNSKIFVLININGGFLNTGSNERMNVRVVVTPSGGSQADVAYVSRYALAAGISGGLGGETQSVTALYTPTSLVEHTFKCQIKNRHGNGCIINTNDASNVQLADNATNSTVTLMEVLG